jgi:dTDP-4-dehydrorhamnose 3,5-epimerase
VNVAETSLRGCFELRPEIREDVRGRFVKTFSRELFARLGLSVDFVEQFYSVSRKGVLRGLHFQLPPRALDKLVTCIEGKVLDVLLDLRRGSGTYGRHIVLELSAETANEVYIPAGLAHGFYTLSERATLLYGTTCAYSPEHDTGIRWDSAGIPWPDAQPIVSPRDAALPALADFLSPF